MGELHDGGDHVVVGLTEDADGGVSGAASVLHNHVDVLGSKTLLGQGDGVVLSLLVLSGCGLGLTGNGWLLSGELLCLSLGKAGVGVLESELTEYGE